MSEMLEAQGTKLEMNTGDGSAVETMDPTIGNPTILTKADHGLTNGDVGVLSAFAGTDADDMNGETVVVGYVTDDTFAVDIDTTGKTLTAENGTITPQTYTEIGNVLDLSVDSDNHNMIDYTTLASTRAEEKPGIARGSAITFAINWTSDDAGLLAAEVARAAQTEKTWKITYPDDSFHTFIGFVSGINNSGSVDDKMSGSLTVHRTGALTLS